MLPGELSGGMSEEMLDFDSLGGHKPNVGNKGDNIWFPFLY